jgi:hypothetical protein
MIFRLTSFLNVPVFVVTLAIGIFLVYLGTGGDKRKIYVYPTPETVAAIQYKDRAGTCFGYTQTKVKCPADEKEISKIPIQS